MRDPLPDIEPSLAPPESGGSVLEEVDEQLHNDDSTQQIKEEAKTGMELLRFVMMLGTHVLPCIVSEMKLAEDPVEESLTEHVAEPAVEPEAEVAAGILINTSREGSRYSERSKKSLSFRVEGEGEGDLSDDEPELKNLESDIVDEEVCSGRRMRRLAIAID